MNSKFPVSKVLDLRSDGKLVQSFTPSTVEQSVDFKIEAVRGDAGGAYKRVTSICGRLRVGVDQPSSGSNVINWDQLFRIIAGLPIDSPMLGQLCTKEVTSGPILKHLVEFIGNGYGYAEGARAQIAAADGDTAVDLYFRFPFAQYGFCRPHDFSVWLGWLEKTVIRFYLGTTTAIDAVSTGAVIEATCNLQMWAEYDVDNDVEIPVISHWQLHRQSASGGTTVRLQNLGAVEGLRRVPAWGRLATLAMLTDVAGMGGPDGADNVTALRADKLDLERIENIDAVILAYRRAIGAGGKHVGGVGASTPLHDGAGNPETMAATPSATLNSSTLMYLPWFAPGRDQEISKLKIVQGDYDLTYGFTTAPSSGEHRHVTQLIRGIDKDQRADLIAAAGGRVSVIKTEDGIAPNAVLAKENPRRFATLPRQIIR